jgi:hypothetical protein
MIVQSNVAHLHSFLVRSVASHGMRNETGGIIVVCMEKKAEGSSSIPGSLRHGGTLTKLRVPGNAEQAVLLGPTLELSRHTRRAESGRRMQCSSMQKPRSLSARTMSLLSSRAASPAFPGSTEGMRGRSLLVHFCLPSPATRHTITDG